MIRRPWLGFVLSLALHAVALASVPVLTSRDDRLPELIIDLRDPFVPGPAPVAPPPREPRPARPSAQSEALPAKAIEKKTESVTAAPEPPLPAPSVPTPAPPPVARTVEAQSPPAAPTPPAPAAPAPAAASAPASPGPTLLREASGLRPSSSFVATTTREPVAQTNGGTVTSGPTAPATSDERAGSTVAPAAPDRAPAQRSEVSGFSGPRVASVPPARMVLGAGAEYGPYLTALRQRIQESVRYPATARRRGLMGTVSVEILILVNGAISEVKLLESSTHSVLDDAALDTLRSLPRVPLPPELPARPLRVRVPVVFEMR